MSRPGRPKGDLPEAVYPLTRQVRALVDRAHGGNLREASTFTGVPYGTLRDLYRGRSRDPGIGTLERLGRPYDLDPAWFLSGASALASASFKALFPPDADTPAAYKAGRGMEIPVASGPLYRVFQLLWGELTRRPPVRDRPILGGTTDEEECRRRLTLFLLAPLLKAWRLGEGAPRTRPAYPGAPVSEDEWLGRLQAIGRMWEALLPRMLAQARREGARETGEKGRALRDG